MKTLYGIVGVPYCGSTILGSLLGLSPGVAAVGEVDYLVRWPECPELLETPVCNRCGVACPVWTPEVRNRPWTWDHLVPDIAALFPDAGSLVLSTKYPYLYDRFEALDVAILLVRHPRACALSTQNHLGTAPAAYYPVWVSAYQRMARWVRKRPHAIVAYERFMEHPLASLRGLCSALGFAHADAIPAPRDLPDHQFAGSAGMRQRPNVSSDRSWETTLMVGAPADALALYETLMERAL